MKSRCNPFLAALAFATTSHAATLYWDGAGTLSTNWTNAVGLYAQGDGSDPAASAGANDDVVFVYTGLDNTMYLSQTTGTISVRSLTFNNTGISQIRAGGAARTLNIGAGGITVNSGAGAVLLGRANGTTGAVTQTYRLAANQTWTNNDDDTVDFHYGGTGAGSGALGSAIDTNAKILTLAGTGNFSLDTPISGTGSLIKGGGGTATIGHAFGATGANSYTGTTTVNDGTLILQGGNAIPDAGAVTLADATAALIQLNASETIGSLAGGGTIGGNVNLQANTLTLSGTNTTTFAGVLSGTGGLTRQGGGTLALSGSNTYEGSTTVSAGSLVFLNTASKPSLSAVSVSAGATLGLGVGTAPTYFTDTEIDALFANTLPGVTMDPASNIGIDTTAGDYTCASNLAAGTKGLTKLGGNTLTLIGTNAYAGPTSINSGALLISAANHLGDATQATNSINLGTATLRSSANTYDLGTNRSITITGTGTIQVDTGILTVSGTVSGANSLTKSGAGTLALSGSNSYSGETIISSGTLQVDSPSGLGTTSRVRFTNGAASLNNNSSGVLSIAGLASNINSSAQQITGGELLVTGLAENVQTTGFGGWTFNNTKTTLAGGLKLSVDNNRNFWINGSAEIIVSGNVVQAGTNSTLQYSGSGTGSLTLSGATNTHSGGVVLNSGTLKVNSPTAFGAAAGTFTIGNATLDNTSASAISIANNNPVSINGNFTFTGTRNLHLGTGAVSLGTAAGTARTITTNAGILTLGGVISNGTTAAGLIKEGNGTLHLGAANTYTGDTTVNGGPLSLGDGSSNSNLADTSVVSVASGATLNLNFLSANTDTVKELWLGGVQKDAGVYSSSDPSGLITGSGTLTVTTGPSSSPYDTWATNPPHNLSGPNAAFDFDYDNDGLDNGLEWILGGNPTQNDNPSILPVITGSATSGLTLVFNRATDSLPPASTLIVDLDSDLDATWAKSVTIGAANSGPDANGVTVAVDTPSIGKVTVVIPASNAAGGRLFSRLRAVKP